MSVERQSQQQVAANNSTQVQTINKFVSTIWDDYGDQKENRIDNLTLVLHERLRMELEQRPMPSRPKADEVTLATRSVGICGSDVKYWQTGKIGRFVLERPMVLGHETSAQVIAVGANVRDLRVGDRVAVEVGVPCAACDFCRRGKYNLCPEMVFAATPPHDGTLTRYFNHRASFCFKLPDHVSYEEGAMLEPLAVALHACQRAPIRQGDVVLVCGAGAVGLLSMLTAKALGASDVVVTDMVASRLELARKMGASATFLVERGATAESLAERVRAFVGANCGAGRSGGVDVALECSGAESSVQLAIHSAGVGAQIVCVGCQADSIKIPLNCAVMQEVDIKGVFRYRHCYPAALALVASGKIDLQHFVTHRFPLERAQEAFELCLSGRGVKIMIDCAEESAKTSATSASIDGKDA